MSRFLPDLLDFPELAELRGRTSAKWRTYGPEVLPAFVAEMDVALAEPVQQALLDAVRRSDTGYRWPAGLGEALAGFAADRWSWAIDPESVLVLPDVLTCLEQSLLVLTAPGEGVIINSPVYPPFWSTVRDITGRTIVDVPLARDGAGRYALDVDAMLAAFARPEVTAWVLCSPHNPTGTMPTRDELDTLAQAAAEHGVAMIADEIHAPLAYPGRVHTPLLTVAPQGAVAVALVSASKAWNLAGLKCAQVVAADDRVARRLRAGIPMERTFATGHLGVIAAIAAYREGSAWLDEACQWLDTSAMRIADVLAARLPAVGYVPPSASYLAWLDCQALDVGADPSAVLLERGHVATSPGRTFGPNGAGFLRLNFGTSPQLLDEILDRMIAALAR